MSISSTLLLLCAWASATVALATPALEFVFNASNINSLQSKRVVSGGVDSDVVRQLGFTDSLAACGAACIAWQPPPTATAADAVDAAGAVLRCRSFTRYGNPYAPNTSLAGRCFGHIDGAWLPLPQDSDRRGTIDAGAVAWPCATDLDCSLNGKCGGSSAGVCACDVGWEGRRCESLDLLPVDRAVLGFSPTRAGGVNMSSWGGSVQQRNGTWHMWASLLAHHCGIGAYLLNSGVAHAVSTSGSVLGPYEERVPSTFVLPPFAHEPVVAVAPTGELVMASVTGPVGTTPGATHASCVCATGTTSNASCKCDNACVVQTPTISVAASAAGPWRSAPMFSSGAVHGENPSVWIDRGGSLWGVSRGGRTSSFASDWRDPATYVHGGGWPGGKPSTLGGEPDVEDPFVYQDAGDRFHQLIHNLEGPHMCGGVAGSGCLVGVHAYSLDGVAWNFGGVAYRSEVAMTDGTKMRLNRRERPHLVFAEGTRRPVALTTSAEAGGTWGDRSFTLVQGINQRS